MPIFFQQDIDEHTKLAVWKIEENEDFFLKKVMPQRAVTHPHKRLQHLAGRYLLRWLYPDFPLALIRIADTRKPFLENEAFHFSISHCGDFAAVIVSRNKRVGVDIEIVSGKIERISHKFLSAPEMQILHPSNPLFNSSTFQLVKLLTLAWSCKEAVFKWYGWGSVDFKEHIRIVQIEMPGHGRIKSLMHFKKTHAIALELYSICFDDIWLSYVAS